MTGYRKEIDGLRAIAVVAVLLYHAKFQIFGQQFLPGGFLGVDIFFVISGYLISKILFSELNATGKISLFSFYERRARRILPALIVVSLFTLTAGWFFLIPEDFVDLSASILAAFLFVSNFFFYFETTEYGADDALLEPFLHTWSLAVEEQFYLVFPLLLLSLFLWQRPRTMSCLVALSVVSFGFALAFSRIDSDLNFFLPVSRIWELLAGAIVAYRESYCSRKPATDNSTWTGLVLVLSLCAILLPLFLVQSTHRHPGFVTMPVVLGTALILAYGSSFGPVGKLLSCRAAIAVGLISYSLYLWHFPIFAFGRLTNVLPEVQDKLLWITLALLCASASYHFVEQPFRDRKRVPGKPLAFSLSLSLCTIMLLSGLVLQKEGFPSRLPDELRPYTSETGYRTLRSKGKRCHNHRDGFCELQVNPDKKTVVILFGDSHADSLSNDLYRKLETRDIGSFIQMTASGCSVILGFSIEKRKSCTPELVQSRFDLIEKLGSQNRTITIYFSRTPAYLSGKRYDGGPGRVEEARTAKHVVVGDRAVNLSRTLDRIAQVTNLIIVYPMPELGLHAQRYFLERIRPNQPGEMQRVMDQEPLGAPEGKFRERAAASYELLDQIPIPDTQRVYPEEFLCGVTVDNWCTAHKNGQLLYVDSNHPNWILADTINDKILEQIDRILATQKQTQ